jgi:hypothetical protein
MKRVLFNALWALGSLLLLANGAQAHTYTYQCTATVNEIQARINGTSPWTTTDGGAGTTAPIASGDIVLLDSTTHGFLCSGDIFVNTSGVTFGNHSGTSSLSTDAIVGMIEVAGANITINGLKFTCHCASTTANTTGLGTFTEEATILLHDGATVLFENGEIIGSFNSGIFATGSSSISVVNSTIVSNGDDQILTDPRFSSGIAADIGSRVRLGNPDHTGPVTIAANGDIPGGSATCFGYGLFLTGGSTLESFAATIGGAGTTRTTTSQNVCGQILLLHGSSARLEGNTVTQTTVQVPAVQVLEGSALIATDNGAPSPVGTSISSGDAGAILLAAVSSATLQGSAIGSTGTSTATFEAAGSSTVTLAGGNFIANTTTGGIAFQIDHSSSLMQVLGQQLGFANAADTVEGSAFVQVQSSADLGVGLIGGNPSLNWSVPAGNCILVQQNSSFRLSGGVAIAGAPAATCALNGNNVSTTIVIQQESNAFFNVGRGGALTLSGGGDVSCVFTTFPNAHVNGKGNITPPGAQPVMIGSWPAANTATSPGCLGP